MLNKLYDRCLELARHKLSKPFLAFISFIESSFFPIPPDVMTVSYTHLTLPTKA